MDAEYTFPKYYTCIKSKLTRIIESGQSDLQVEIIYKERRRPRRERGEPLGNPLPSPTFLSSKPGTSFRSDAVPRITGISAARAVPLAVQRKGQINSTTT